MNVITGDEVFSKVFGLDPEEYSRKLDETFKSKRYKPIFSNFRSL